MAQKISNNEMKRRVDARENARASIEDTARIMPEYLEAKYARQEKLHPLVITNRMDYAEVVDAEFSPSVVVDRQGSFVLVSAGPKSRRASWYRIKKSETPKDRKADEEIKKAAEGLLQSIDPAEYSKLNVEEASAASIANVKA